MLVGVGSGDWRQTIGHDGYFVVRLRLFTVEEGGQDRHIQSGFRATWAADDIPHAMDGPIDLADDTARSIAPGREAVVHVHPLQPLAWVDVAPGMHLRLCRNWPRALGEGVVLERVRVPQKLVPLRIPEPLPGRAAVAVLHRRPTLGERVRWLFRR